MAPCKQDLKETLSRDPFVFCARASIHLEICYRSPELDIAHLEKLHGRASYYLQDEDDCAERLCFDKQEAALSSQQAHNPTQFTERYLLNPRHRGSPAF